MINFHVVIPGKLYRGGSPTPNDVKMLKQKYGVEKIVSLDLETAIKINLACALMGVQHLIFPIDINKRITLIPFLNNLEEIFKLDVPTFVHCARGADRTGMALAIYRCQYEKWPASKAIAEARKLGFGQGLPRKITKLFLKVIHEHCSDEKDQNHAEDILAGGKVDGPFDDYYQGFQSNLSFAPYSDYSVRTYPFSPIDFNDRKEQFPTRENWDLDDELSPPKEPQIPFSGHYETVDALNGMGYSNVNNGFI